MRRRGLSPRGYEALVVGGGPAGSVCAAALARAGVSVALINGARREPFGVELLSGRGRHIIGEFWPEFWRADGFEIRETVSLWRDSTVHLWSAMSNPYGPGIAVSRDELDSHLRRLARDAGVRIIDGCWARMVERNGGTWRINAASRPGNREFRAELLILATGRGASDLLGRRPCKQLRSVAITASAGATALPRYAMYLEETEKGWWYAMPSLNDAAFVGYCLRDRRAVTGRAEPTFRQALAETTSIRRVLAGVSYLTVRGRSACVREYNNVFGDGWLAIGDAAFSPDPSSGQGLEFAVESGLCAARWAASGTTAAIGATLRELVTRQSIQHDRHGIWARVDG